MRSIRRRLYEVLETPNRRDPLSVGVTVTIVLLILLSTASMIVETVPRIEARWGSQLRAFEIASASVFLLEYMLRLWAAGERDRIAASPVLGRVRYACHPLLLIDLLAIVPTFLPFVGLDLRSIRLLRCFRFLRLAKLGRYSNALKLIGQTIRRRREELMLTVVGASILMLFASIAMYYAERDAQPEQFGSVPQAMWWSVVTLTTVGYGDVYPITPIGKALGAVIAVLGVGFFALPTGIIGAGFIDEIQRGKQHTKSCPHCGGELP